MGSRRVIAKTFLNDTMQKMDDLKDLINYDAYLDQDLLCRTEFLCLTQYTFKYYIRTMTVFSWITPMIDAALVDIIENPNDQMPMERILQVVTR
jgi:hypothetical protein